MSDQSNLSLKNFLIILNHLHHFIFLLLHQIAVPISIKIKSKTQASEKNMNATLKEQKRDFNVVR